jgi:tetratricopeptide (TPR) repeat protein
MTIAPGIRLGPYEIVGPLGAGGMGEVYRATDARLGRQVAIKLLPGSFASDPDRLRRFVLEARAAGSLTHPSILAIYDIGEYQGSPYIVSELIEGTSLRDRLKDGPLPPDQAIELAIQVAGGLATAHAKGIVHRDLKPENILIGDGGFIKIIDFGLAKLLDTALPVSLSGTSQLETQSGMTQRGYILGTFSYMSPEQARGEIVDVRSDIFSFGVVLYEMLAGSGPFNRPSTIETLSAILRDDPPPVHLGGGIAPPDLQRVVNRALAKDPDKRYAGVEQMLGDLRALRDTPMRGGIAIVRRVGHWVRRSKRPATLALTAAAVLVAVMFGAYLTARRAPPAADVKPVSVLVGDFANQTGEAVFDGALAPTFNVTLEGATFVASYGQAAARRLAAQLEPGATILDERVTRLVAVREGISVVTIGAIARAGDGYRLSVRALDAVTGAEIVNDAQEVAGKEAVLKAVNRLAARVRRALGDTTPESKQLAEAEMFTSRSLDAVHDYAAAQEFQVAGRYDEAASLYQRALELDPDLGRAWAGLAVIAIDRGQREDAQEYFRKAMASIGRMSEREQFRTQGIYYLMTRQLDQAVDELRELVEAFPADTSGLSSLALAYFLKRDMEKALAEGRRAVEIYPKNVLWRNSVGLYALYASDLGTAVTEQRAVLDLNPDLVKGYAGLALAQLGLGQVNEARATWKALAGKGSGGASAAATGLADLALYLGKPDEAIAVLGSGIDDDIAAGDSEAAATKLAMLGEAQLARGATSQALVAAVRARAASSSETVKYGAALVLLAAGDARAALEAADELDRRLEPDPQMYARLIRAELALAAGDPRAALARFQEAQEIADSWLGRFGFGRAYLAAGAYPEAQSELDECLRRRGEAIAVFLDEVPTARLLPPVHYHLGHALEGLGHPRAAEQFRAYLAIRGGGSDPLTTEARRRL